MVKISIIMPVYNGAKFLQKSIESVAKQTLKDLELICVDDGSTDNSLEVLNNLSKKYEFIKIISQENNGAGSARNNGIKNAVGEYIAFLDADDEFFDEDALERMYDSNKDNAGMISANLVMIENDNSIRDNFFYTMKDYRCFEKEEVIDPKDYGAPLSFYKNMFKRNLIIDNDIVFPDFRRGQDPPFLAKVLTLIDKIQGVPVNLYGHHYRVAGGAENKIDTYEKKHGYIQHFKDTYEILKEGGLSDLADFYRIHLFRYLVRPENIDDPETFEMFNEIWGLNNTTFDETDFNYVRFMVPAKFYFIHKLDSEEFFYKVNKDFLQFNIYDTFAIDEKVIDKYFLVIFSYSLEDFKSNCDKLLSNNLKFKKEFEKYKVDKFMFNISIHGTPVVLQNAKRVFLNAKIWDYDSFSKNSLKKCYRIIKDESIVL